MCWILRECSTGGFFLLAFFESPGRIQASGCGKQRCDGPNTQTPSLDSAVATRAILLSPK